MTTTEARAPHAARAVPRIVWPLAALAALLLYNLATTPGFWRLEVKQGHLYGSLVDVVNQAAPVMLVTLGMAFVLATGGVDLSVGAVMAVSGAVAALLLTRGHASLPLAALAAIAVSGLLGCWNGLLVAGLRMQPIIATLVLMVAGRGVAQLLTEGQIITVDDPAFGFLGGGYVLGLPFTLFVAAALFAAAGVLARGTALGLFVEAVGENEVASRGAGVPVRAVKLAVYALAGLCAGVAGLLDAADIRAADANNAGLYIELDAILAAVIGGTSLSGGRFYLGGAVVGALLIQALTTTILTKGVPVEYTLVVKAPVVLAVCLLQSESLRAMVWRRRARG